MRIGLTGAAGNAEGIIRQAERAEAEGFSALWYPGQVLGDALAAITIAGRATSTIELGTAIVPTYLCHPVFQASRAAAAAMAIGSAGRVTLGIGPSHAPVIEALGMSYATPGRHTEEYVQIVTTLLRGEAVNFSGEEFRTVAGPPTLVDGAPIPVLVSALAPRLLRVAGQYTDGTILWLGTAAAIDRHVAPRIRKAAAEAGRPEPRIVAGLPIAVHDDVAEARAAAAEQFAVYATLPNYLRLLDEGGVRSPADAAIVGDESSVAAQIAELFDAGATDLWAAPFGVGDDASASRARTRALLRELAAG